MAIHKGTELNNVNETWDRTEQLRNKGIADADHRAGTTDNLDRTIKEEAAEYDTAGKEDRLLDGDRATVKDAPDEPA